MKTAKLLLILCVFLATFLVGGIALALEAPVLTVTTSETTVSLSWTSVAGATGYTLYYAPYPYTGPESIGNITLGDKTSMSASLSEGAAFFVALQAYDGVGSSGYSNIEHFIIAHSLSVSPSSLSISQGQTGSCTLSGGTAPYSAVSANTSVARVSMNGSILTVTGVSAGSSTVTASDSASGSVTVAVTVSGSLIVSPTSLAMTVGATGSCTLSGGTAPYSAVSANTSVARVSMNGSILTVTGVSAGSSTVTASDSASGSVTVAVTVSGSLIVSPTSLAMTVGATGSCTLSGGTAPYSAVSANTSVARVSMNGSILTVTGVSAGSSTVTASDSASGSVTVAVTVSGSLIVSPTSLAMTVGATGSCTLSGGTAPYSAVSANTSVARVSMNGSILTVTGVSAGSSTVTVSDSASGSVTVAVTVIPQDLTVMPTSLSILPGQTGSCTLSGGTAPYSAVSANTSVARVSMNGSILTVTGVSAGSSTVTVSDSGRDSATVSVTVTDYTNTLGMTFILLPAGTFTMGSPSSEPGRDSAEGPQHQVTLTQPFYMQQTEVTQAQWEAVMGSNPSYFSGCPTCPVEEVSWDDAQDYIVQMNLRGEGTYGLPTEAQWEYAYRAGSTTAFYNGAITEPEGNDPNLDVIGWYNYNSGDETHAVAGKAPNAWGLYDMGGNVYEWCQDWYSSSYYDSSPSTDPAGPSSGSMRVVRGGSWANRADTCRAANRNRKSPDIRYTYRGFRLILSPGQQ